MSIDARRHPAPYFFAQLPASERDAHGDATRWWSSISMEARADYRAKWRIVNQSNGDTPTVVTDRRKIN